jgi:hypothetical protein
LSALPIASLLVPADFASKTQRPSVSPSELITSYRLHAANCIEIAHNLEPERKLAFLNIAQAWLNLAEQIAKNLDTVLVYETPVSPPDFE